MCCVASFTADNSSPVSPQTITMGPCTFLVTSAVTSSGVSMSERVKMVWADKGIKGFYPGPYPPPSAHAPLLGRHNLARRAAPQIRPQLSPRLHFISR